MRKIQKILLGSFLTGVLICGVGAGTAIGEYSSLTYLGERILTIHLIRSLGQFAFIPPGTGVGKQQRFRLMTQFRKM